MLEEWFRSARSVTIDPDNNTFSVDGRNQFSASSVMPRNDRGFGLGADVARTGHGQTVGAVSLRSGRGHGLTTDAVADWTRTGCGHGLTTDNLWSRTGHGQIRGKFPVAARKLAWLSRGLSRTLPGNCPAVARMLRRTLRRTLRGLRRQLRSHLPTIVPTIVRTLARTFIGV